MKEAVCLLVIGTAMVLIGGAGMAGEVTILTRPETVTLVGDPESTWVVDTSRKVPGEPRAVYRCTVEVRSQITSGIGNVTIRMIAADDQSISYQGVANVSPQPLDFTVGTGVFISHERTVELQAYYRLNRVSGTASFRNLKLEKLTGSEAEEALKAFVVPLVHFSLPVYCYSDETRLDWGYRINAQLNPRSRKVAGLVFECAGREFPAERVPQNDRWVVESAGLHLPEGTHELRARAFDAAGNVLSEETARIRSIRRPTRRNHLPVTTVAVDEHNNLVVNGVPVFPMGLYHVYTRDQMRQIREQGFNCIQIWGETPDHFKQMLDWAHMEGLMSWTVTKMVKDDYLTKLVTAFKDHPAHFMWDLVDEPAIRNITPQSVKSKADVIRSIDPDHPIKISFADRRRAIEYRDSLDIVASHTYPMPYGRVTRMGDVMQALAATFDSAVPHHASPQAWMSSNDVRQIEQTVAQTRGMTYLAIIHGAKGLYYYSFIDHGAWDLRQHPRLWSTFKGLTWEIETLSNVILMGRRIGGMTVSTPKVQCAAWEHDGDHTLIAVNTVEEQIEAQFTLPGSFVVCKVFEEEQRLVEAEGLFNHRFTPLETLMLKLKRKDKD